MPGISNMEDYCCNGKAEALVLVFLFVLLLRLFLYLIHRVF